MFPGNFVALMQPTPEVLDSLYTELEALSPGITHRGAAEVLYEELPLLGLAMEDDGGYTSANSNELKAVGEDEPAYETIGSRRDYSGYATIGSERSVSAYGEVCGVSGQAPPDDHNPPAADCESVYPMAGERERVPRPSVRLVGRELSSGMPMSPTAQQVCCPSSLEAPLSYCYSVCICLYSRWFSSLLVKLLLMLLFRFYSLILTVNLES